MEPPDAKRAKVAGEGGAQPQAQAQDSIVSEDFFPLEHLPPEIFATLLAPLSYRDVVNLSQVSTAFVWLVQDDTWSSSVWGHFLRSDYGIAEVGAYEVPARQIYIQMARSRWNPGGLPWPGVTRKQLKHDQKIQKFCQNNKIKPFWVLNLGHTNRTRRLAADLVSHARSHFRQGVLHGIELNRIQIEGEAFVRFPGYYRIEWRFLLQSYALHQPTFIARVLAPGETRSSTSVYVDKFSFDFEEPNTEKFYKWIWHAGQYEPQRGPEQALPVNDFFEVITGKLHVTKPNSSVIFQMVESGLEWKYDFFLDYISVIPITKKQYEELEIVSPNRNLPPLPPPAPAPAAGAPAAPVAAAVVAAGDIAPGPAVQQHQAPPQPANADAAAAAQPAV